MISFITKPKTIGIHSAITNTFDISNTCIVRRWHAHDVFSVLFWPDPELVFESAVSSSELAETDSFLSLLSLSCGALSIELNDWLRVGFELCFWKCFKIFRNIDSDTIWNSESANLNQKNWQFFRDKFNTCFTILFKKLPFCLAMLCFYIALPFSLTCLIGVVLSPSDVFLHY